MVSQLMKFWATFCDGWRMILHYIQLRVREQPMLEFVDKCIVCHVPKISEDNELRLLLMRLQRHTHSVLPKRTINKTNATIHVDLHVISRWEHNMYNIQGQTSGNQTTEFKYFQKFQKNSTHFLKVGNTLNRQQILSAKAAV